MSEDFWRGAEERRARLRKRRYPLAAEMTPPNGQAALWYGDVIQCVPRSGQDVARQMARLCGDDSEVTIPWRSLSDAVGVRDRGGRAMAWTQRGVKALEDAGWLEVETVGSKRGAKTTFRLLAGDRGVEWLGWVDEDDWLNEAA